MMMYSMIIMTESSVESLGFETSRGHSGAKTRLRQEIASFGTRTKNFVNSPRAKASAPQPQR